MKCAKIWGRPRFRDGDCVGQSANPCHLPLLTTCIAGGVVSSVLVDRGRSSLEASRWLTWGFALGGPFYTSFFRGVSCEETVPPSPAKYRSAILATQQESLRYDWWEAVRGGAWPQCLAWGLDLP
jgi:hypothetical protein